MAQGADSQAAQRGGTAGLGDTKSKGDSNQGGKMKSSVSLIAFLILSVSSVFADLGALPLTAAAGSTVPVNLCLYYVSGPYAGQPARVAGAGVYYDTVTKGWVKGSGGHTHDSGAVNSRPQPFVNGSQPKLTDSNGCISYNVSMPNFSGYFHTEARIDAVWCSLHGQVCAFPPDTDFDIQVVNVALDGGPFTQLRASTGYTRPASDTQHSITNNYASSATGGALKLVGDYYRQHTTDPSFSIVRASLPQGGWLDGYLVGALWYPINADRHMYGFTVDMLSPGTSIGKTTFLNGYATYCAQTVYDFYNQTAITASEKTGTSTYLWHAECAPWLGTWPGYPN